MNTATLVGAFVRREPLAWFFHVLTLALGAAIVLSLVVFERSVAQHMSRNLAGVDLVIGAKGSPAQLVLSALLHVDAPTGNIPAAEAARFSAHPLVKTAVPVSLGDSVGGARIVGTTIEYADLFEATLAKGRWWQGSMEAVLGAAAANKLHLVIGDEFAGQHGLSGGQAHATRYRVTGILAPTGSTIDRLVLTDQASVWAVHEAHEPAPSETPVQTQPEESREITALLVRYRSAMGAIVLPRLVSATPDLQPAMPPVEIGRLVNLLGVGSAVLQWIGVLLLSLAAAGFVIALFTAFGQRRRELALLRALGASRRLLVVLVAAEGAVLGFIGGVFGIVLSRGLLLLVSQLADDTALAAFRPAPLDALEFGALLIAVLLALLASLPAAWRASRLDPAASLAFS